MKSILAWFTPPKRKAIYAIVAVGSASLVTFNVITSDQLNQFVVSIGYVVTALTSIMAAANTNPSGGDGI